MQRKCRELKCDRCGETILLEKIDVYEEYEHDIDIFEDPPAGWSVFNGFDLCPECTKELENLMNGFFNRSETEETEKKSNEEYLDTVKNALLTLNHECNKHDNCLRCPFYYPIQKPTPSMCYLRNHLPSNYNINAVFRE